MTIKKIAVFDFDETLVKENSLSYLFKYLLGNKPLFLYLFPILLNYRIYIGYIKLAIKLRLYKKALTKSDNEQVFQAGINTAAKLTVIQSVVTRMKLLNSQGVEIWIITASPQTFIEGVVVGMEWPVKRVIGTLMELDNGLLNGRIDKECQDQEKIIRFNDVIKQENLKCVVEEAYGNLPVDIPMLSLAKHQYSVTNGVLSSFVRD